MTNCTKVRKKGRKSEFFVIFFRFSLDKVKIKCYDRQNYWCKFCPNYTIFPNSGIK